MEFVLSVVDEGTELRCLVATIGGDVVGTAVSPGPASSRHIGHDGLRRRLQGLVADAIAGLNDPVCLAACASLADAPERVREMLADLVPLDGERVLNTSLERAAAAGSLGSAMPARVVVIRADVGSRSWAVAEPGRESERGGFGEVLGDEGSAYWIGRRGIASALRAFEKRYRNTTIKARLLSHFGVTTYTELLAPDYQPPPLDRYQIAGFAPEVFAAAEQGDEVALEILDEAGRDLATMALALINELDLALAEFSVLPSGSVFRLRGVCLEAFMKALKNKTTKVNLVKEGMGPAAGAILLGIHHLGLKVRPQTADVLRASLKARE